MKYCKRCGNALDDKAVICVRCGEPSKKISKDKYSFCLILISILLPAVGLIVAYVLYGQGNNKGARSCMIGVFIDVLLFLLMIAFIILMMIVIAIKS